MNNFARRRNLIWAVGVVATLLALTSLGHAQAVKTDMMTVEDTTIIMKVTPGSDKIVAVTAPGNREAAFRLEILRPYFVISEEGEYYRITDQPTRTVAEAEAGNVGYVEKRFVHLWKTLEALHFTPLITADIERTAIKAWKSRAMIKDYLATGEIKTYAPAFEEAREFSRKKPKFLRPYPVLSNEV